jgi:hypothetical protein
MTPESQNKLLKLRSLSIDKSFDEIHMQSSLQENRYVLENLYLLQRSIRDSGAGK